MNPYVVVGCGAKKRTEPTAAGDLYLSPYVRAAVEWARSVTTPDRVLILSALHGLIPQEQVVEPYDVTWGDPAQVSDEQLAEQIRSYGLSGPVMLLASPRYADRLHAASGGTVHPYNPFAELLVSTGRDLRRGYQTQALRGHIGCLPGTTL